MFASQMPTPQFYDQEDVQQILQLAIARQDYQGELSREQLWEIAAELNIPSESLQAAEQDWLNKKLVEKQREAFNNHRKQQLKQKIVRSVIFNAFFVCLNVLIVGHLSWSLYILLFWGLWLALNVWQTSQFQGEAYEEAFRSWQRRHELQQTFSSIWHSLRKAWQS